MNKLNENIKVGWRISGHLSVLIFFVFVSAFVYTATKNIVYVAIPLVVFLILVELFVRLGYKNYKYELTEDAVKIERGVIVKVYKSIPYGRIQNVDIRRGILARILGYSTVMIHTAGYSGPAQNMQAEGVLPGVDILEAEKIRESIVKMAKK